jgi:hypothetical protein
MDRCSAEAELINPRAKMSEIKILRLDFIGLSVEAIMSGRKFFPEIFRLPIQTV